MFEVTIRDHIMIAHSLDNEEFGPARNLHGATYVVDATFKRVNLDEKNLVINIDTAHKVLESVLVPLKYQNLDQLEQFNGVLTTTEYLAWYIHHEISRHVKKEFSGTLKVTLGESHVAWAGYESEVD